MISDAKRHHFLLGIGGIGMSAIARHLRKMGHVVAGYDLTRSPLTEALEREGMAVVHDDDLNALPDWVMTLPPSEMSVVWTPAVPRQLGLLQALEGRGHALVKRAAMLGTITQGRPTLAVAGTHGKTTTSSMLAAMFREHIQPCHAFLGGIDALTQSNYLTAPNAHWHVVEADEFDRSFHHLHPTHAAITTVDPDHLDVYDQKEALLAAFVQFGSQVSDTLLLPEGLPWPAVDGPQIRRFEVVQAGTKSEATYHAILQPDAQTATFCLAENPPFKAKVSLPGKHNVANALVAAALAHCAGLTPSAIAKGMEHFQGVHRRFDVHLDSQTKVYVDDYAHHPTELQALIDAVKARWPHRHITLVFQPHLYSRTRDFMAEFAQALGSVDQVWLLPIYPAREQPIPGVDAQWLFENISGNQKKLVSSKSIFDSLKACPVDVLVTAGAGDIDRLVPDLLQHLQSLEN